MPENNPPDPPPAKRNKKGLIQSNAEARSATKNTSKKPPKRILPPPQIEESSESVELAAGETPSASPIEKTATDPKMTMQVPVCQVTYAGLRAIDGIQPVYQPSERPENHFS